MKKFFVKFILILTLICLSFIDLNSNIVNNNINEDSIKIDSVLIVDTVFIELNNINDSLKNSIKAQLIDEVERHIMLKTRYSKLSYHKDLPSYLVEHGLNMNFNICFMMAQTQIETNYGTAGIGRETSKRSLFGFISKSYKNYNDAIINYITTIKKNYLGDKKTEIHLLKSYKTLGGARYASDINYELKLTKAYNYLTQNTNIQKLQDLYYSYGNNME